MPINVNKCLLDIACNQLISIHLNVEFVEVVPVPLASLYLPLDRPLQMGLINSQSIHPSVRQSVSLWEQSAGHKKRKHNTP